MFFCISTEATIHQDKVELEEKPRTTSSNSTDHQRLTERERDIKHQETESEKIKYLDRTIAKLCEELKRNKGEIEHVEKITTTLTEQNYINNQKDILTVLLQELNNQIEDNKMLVQNASYVSILTYQRAKRVSKREGLESRKTEHEELLQSTEKLLKTTEYVINKLTEKKKKLKSDREKISKHLKKTERQRDNLQINQFVPNELE